MCDRPVCRVSIFLFGTAPALLLAVTMRVTGCSRLSVGSQTPAHRFGSGAQSSTDPKARA
jgi:hypothetical protein